VEPGFVIADRYRLDRHIAAGGMGSVWRGFDLSLERDVAVKLLLRGLHAADKPAERFAREAKALARVKNPGCVEVYDVGQHRDGDEVIRYIVMELVEGESLKDRLDRSGRLDPAETMARIAEAADALEAAHGVGIVHRDVKPGNLLISDDERTHVVDFGISTLTDATRLTQSNAVLGTLPYVSPEQFEGEETTPESDIYALGAVAYECLTGHPPFTGENSKAIIHAHLFVEPDPLPDAVPAPVAHIVLRALAKDPAERWASCAELAAACRAASDELPAQPPPALAAAEAIATPTSPEPDETLLLSGPRRAPRRKRRTALVLAVAATLVLLGTLVLWKQWPHVSGNLGTALPPAGAEDAESSAATEEAAATTPAPTASPSETATAATTPSTPADGSATPPGTATGGGSGTGDTGGGDDGGNDDGDSGGGSDEAEATPDQPAGDPTVPNVTGDLASDAAAALSDAGFTNIEWVRLFYDSSATSNCEVMDQDPPGGSTAQPTDEIRVEYLNLSGESCF
jgi:serine/threonine protein kinase